MKIALHHSMTFWSGLLVLGFFGYAWRESTLWNSQFMTGPYEVRNHHSAVTMVYSGSAWNFDFDETRASYRELDRLPAPFFVRAEGRTWTPTRADLEVWSEEVRDAPTERERMQINLRYRRASDWALSIPHWLILLAFAVPWLALLLWRAQRRSKAIAG